MPNSYFSEARNVELSIIYFIETSVASDWDKVTVVKSFTNAYKAALPVIAIELSNVNTNRREVGSTTLLNDYIINIDIFATSNGQRIDLAHYISNKLKDGCVYYEHSQTSGDPETLTRIANGRVFVTDYLSNIKVNVGAEVDKYDKYRNFISISVRKSNQ